eukprot:TRINITY_DN19445_c0_g1_i1.p1 TRINITY_DN19445_c0_g1~~TRINITY_DN19445_c0_g1_i1.p1  ORF type:complete len:428 (+),score=97.21 TRINITY_DN19445_c0_g1_i1:54-1286(+)
MRRAVILAAASVAVLARDCEDEFRTGVKQNKEVFFSGCWSSSSIAMFNETDRLRRSRMDSSGNVMTRSDFIARYNGTAEWDNATEVSEEYDESFGDCFDNCVDLGVWRAQPDGSPYPDDVGGRPPVQILWNEQRKGRPGACTCLFCPCVGGMIVGSMSTDDDRCNQGWIRLYDVPLECAGRDNDNCDDDVCSFSGCCYAKGAVAMTTMWMVSRILLQIVFLTIAVAFVCQMLVYSFYRLRQVHRGRHAGHGMDDALLSEQMITATADQYRKLFAVLPTVELSAEGTGTACSICLEDLSAPAGGDASAGSSETGGRVVALPECGHRFHSACIQTYAAHEIQKGRPALCPNCRIKIVPDDGPGDSDAAAATRAPPPPPRGARAAADTASESSGSEMDLRPVPRGRASSWPDT